MPRSLIVVLLTLSLTTLGVGADPAADLVEGEHFQAATELVFTEGPAYHRDGSVYFSDIRNNRIMRLAPGAANADVFLQPSGRSNGLVFDSQGRLLVCEGNEFGGLGGRRLVRIDTVSKQRTIIAARYQGKRFNSLNDLCIDNKGRIYFTDPYYGPFRDDMELDVEAVYRVNPDGENLVRVLGKGQVTRPNGIALSADNHTLYVADNHPIKPVRKLWSFALNSDGLPSGPGKELHDFGKGRGPDGMAIDIKDNLYVTAGNNRLYPNQNLDNPAGIYVFTGRGKFLGVLKVPEDMCTNACFGGPELKTLYVTSGKTLWKIRTKNPGRVIWPR